ncbi:hypothetical protein CDAR_185091 [Caerostris darwini]|uniref:Uncharacterized protein n=1 Tax=Caerostris darwini TaxID=1538125 RepID=A0AAV4SVS5_9ARAC|nr:hypothetical protein CDAR_185091 [Caerostris darwini]
MSHRPSLTTDLPLHTSLFQRGQEHIRSHISPTTKTLLFLGRIRALQTVQSRRLRIGLERELEGIDFGTYSRTCPSPSMLTPAPTPFRLSYKHFILRGGATYF